MFSSSKKKEAAKEQERQALSRQAMLDRYTRICSEIYDMKDKVLEEWGRMEEDRSRLDKSLISAKESVSRLTAAEEKHRELEGEHYEHFRTFFQDMENAEKSFRSLMDEIGGRNEEMLGIVEHNKHFTTPARFLSQVTVDVKQDLDQMQETIQKMQEFGSRMGALSLNAAIEAGRMGEGGLKFIGAAEEVRSLSGSYQEAAEELIKKIGEIGGRIGETQEQVNHLNRLLKDNNIKMGKTTQGFTDSVYRLEHCGFWDSVPRAEELMQEWAAAMDAGDRGAGARADEAVAQAKERFLDQQEAMDALKESWSAILRQMESAKQAKQENQL